MTFFDILRREYNQTVIRKIRRLEEEKLAYSRFKNHRIFLLRCKSERVIPQHLRLKSCIRSTRTNNILQEASRKLLAEDIRSCCSKIKRLEHSIATTLKDLTSHLSLQDLNKVVHYTDACAERAFAKCKSHHLLKFNRLSGVQPKQPETKDTQFVKNLSSVSFTSDQLQVLNLGPKFSISGNKIPYLDIITSVERGLQSLGENEEVDIIRSKIANLVSTAKPAPRNLRHNEMKALGELRKLKNIKIIPADKGGGLVILDSNSYWMKLSEHLEDMTTYLPLPRSPASTTFDKIVSLLLRLRQEGSIDFKTYMKVHPSTKLLPRFYGLPKLHKQDIPLRPIVSCVGTITSALSSFVADIIAPLVGQSSAHLSSTNEFRRHISTVTLEKDEILVSFDVVSLYTSVPLEEAVDIIRRRLKEDRTLQERTTLNVEDICKLLILCLNTTYFTCNEAFFQQTFGAPMGSPISGIVANIFMEEFETEALQRSPISIKLWKRYIDDICSALKKQEVTSLLTFLNSLRPTIRFTVEFPSDNTLPFLDLKLKRQEDGSICTSVFRKPISCGQYLNFRSAHPYGMKAGLVKNLFHRALDYSSDNTCLKLEIKKITCDLKNNGYPDYFIQKCQAEVLKSRDKDREVLTKNYCSIPYVPGLSEAIKRILKQQGVHVTFKPQHTIRQAVIHPKDPIPDTDNSGVVYEISCNDCSSVYIGETKRQLKERVKKE